jgi:hypothetical protein
VQLEPQEEWAAEKAAFAAGKKIQVLFLDDSEWYDIDIPLWESGCKYRIKPLKVYCAGPMSGYADYNFPAFFAASEFLEQQGYTAINPAQLDIDAGYPLERLNLLTPEEFQEFLKGAMKRDLDAIQSCDALVLLPGWEKSKGARAERAVAEWAGLRVGYLWMATCCPTGEQMKLTWEDERKPVTLVGAAGVSGPGPCPVGTAGVSGDNGSFHTEYSDPDGWIPHVPGDPMPCDGDLEIDYKMRWKQAEFPSFARRIDWGICNGASSAEIIAWRPHQPQPKQPYSSDERAEWDVEQPKLHLNDPKGAAGAKKAPMHLLPPSFLEGAANALGYGAEKYGKNNFLHTKVNLSTYMAAIMRHWCSYLSGENTDTESGLSHIDHISANCAIIKATSNKGTIIDDRAI